MSYHVTIHLIAASHLRAPSHVMLLCTHIMPRIHVYSLTFIHPFAQVHANSLASGQYMARVLSNKTPHSPHHLFQAIYVMLAAVAVLPKMPTQTSVAVRNTLLAYFCMAAPSLACGNGSSGTGLSERGQRLPALLELHRQDPLRGDVFADIAVVYGQGFYHITLAVKGDQIHDALVMLVVYLPGVHPLFHDAPKRSSSLFQHVN